MPAHRSSGRHRRQLPRQYKIYALVAATVMIPVTAALFAGGYELSHHGWHQFVFRSAGTGATANDAADLGPQPTPDPTMAPSPVMPSKIMILPKGMKAATVVVHVTAGEVLSVAAVP